MLRHGKVKRLQPEANTGQATHQIAYIGCAQTRSAQSDRVTTWEQRKFLCCISPGSAGLFDVCWFPTYSTPQLGSFISDLMDKKLSVPGCKLHNQGIISAHSTQREIDTIRVHVIRHLQWPTSILTVDTVCAEFTSTPCGLSQSAPVPCHIQMCRLFS